MVHRPQGFTFVYWFITKDIIKDTEKRPDKETCRTRSGRVPSAGQLLSQRSWDTPSSWHVDGLISASWTIRVLFMEALLLRHNWLLTPFPAPLWRLGGRAKNFFFNSLCIWLPQILLQCTGSSVPQLICCIWDLSSLQILNHCTSREVLGLKIEVSNHGFSVWWPVPIQESPYQNKRQGCHPRNSKGFWMSLRNQGQKTNIRTQDAPSVLIT